jgi:hypothetical protein
MPKILPAHIKVNPREKKNAGEKTTPLASDTHRLSKHHNENLIFVKE